MHVNDPPALLWFVLTFPLLPSFPFLFPHCLCWGQCRWALLMSQAPIQNEGSIITHAPEATLSPAYSPGVLSQWHTYFPFLSLFSILCTPCINITWMTQFGNAIVLHSNIYIYFHFIHVGVLQQLSPVRNVSCCPRWCLSLGS